MSPEYTKWDRMRRPRDDSVFLCCTPLSNNSRWLLSSAVSPLALSIAQLAVFLFVSGTDFAFPSQEKTIKMQFKALLVASAGAVAVSPKTVLFIPVWACDLSSLFSS